MRVAPQDSVHAGSSIALGSGGVQRICEPLERSSVGAESYSDVLGGYAGTGNIAADPKFVGGGDLHLQTGSPCIDAADGTAAPATDIEGNARYDRPAAPNTGVGPPWADMGAYEYTE